MWEGSVKREDNLHELWWQGGFEGMGTGQALVKPLRQHGIALMHIEGIGRKE